MNKILIHFLKIAILISIFILAFWLMRLAKESNFITNLVSQYGYGAAFVLGVIGGLNLVVPIPAVTFTPLFLEAGLNFWTVILLITFGMLLADTIAFLLGRTGREFVLSVLGENKIFHKIEKLKNENGNLPFLFLFLFASFAPFPNEVIVMPMGLLNYKFKSLIIPLILGNLIFNILFSFGVINIFNLLF